jgi:hypothetical protein
VRARVDLTTMAGGVIGPHWRDLGGLLPLYHAITTCTVGDRGATSFWEDWWMGCGRLKDVSPLLHSHAVDAEVSVACVLHDSIREHLVPRLTAGARGELDKLSPSSLRCCSLRRRTDALRHLRARAASCGLASFTNS